MKRLDVSNNPINDEGACHLSTCISMIEELHIGNCNITDKGVKMLATAIKKLRKPVMFISEFVPFHSYNSMCFLVLTVTAFCSIISVLQNYNHSRLITKVNLEQIESYF